VLEVQENRWRFAHDKLREGLLENMLPEQRHALHRRVAEAIEHMYPGDPAQTAILALHWGQVGDAQKEVHYAALAGEQALADGADREAVVFLERAIALTDQMGIRHSRQGALERQLGVAYWALGDNAESKTHLRLALILLGWPMPTSNTGLSLGLMAQILRQVVHRIWPSHFIGHYQSDRELLKGAVLTYGYLGRIAIIEGQTLPLLYANFRLLNLAEGIGPSRQLAEGYGYNALTFGLFPPLYAITDKYLHLARETIRLESELAFLASISEASGMCLMHRGQWNEAEDELMRGAQVADSIGLLRLSEECRALLVIINCLRGEFGSGKQLAQQVYTSAHQRGDSQVQFWGLCAQVENEIRLAQAGYLDETILYLQQAEALLLERPPFPDVIRLYGVMAEAHLHRGELELAQEAAEKTLQAIHTEFRPTAIYSFAGYANVPLVCLRLWEATRAGPPDKCKHLQQMARQACKGLWGFARVFPVGKPRAHLWQGVYEWLTGKPKKARKHWQKSLEHAVKLEMPFDEGLAHYEIGRHLPSDDSKRAEHLNKAIEILERLGAAHDLKQAQAALQASNRDDSL
jgi:eukaryotic-like serine/threonine-protein kinase